MMRRRPIPEGMLSSPHGYPYCVYRFYAHDGTLLYVGATRAFQARLDAHCSKPWWNQVDHCQTRTEWFPDAATTSDAENAAIANEYPRHNTCGTPGQSPSKYNPSTVALEARERLKRMTTAELKALCDAPEPV